MNSDVALLPAPSGPKSLQTSYRMGMTRPKTSGIQLCCSAAVLAFLLAGCATTDSSSRSGQPGGTFTTGNAVITQKPVPPVPAFQPPPRRLQVCDAKPVQFYIGHNTVPSTLQTLRKKSGAYSIRILEGNQPATTDLDEERLNVITNDAGRIIALRCG